MVMLVNNTKSKHKLYIGQYDRQEHYKMHHGHTGLEFRIQSRFTGQIDVRRRKLL